MIPDPDNYIAFMRRISKGITDPLDQRIATEITEYLIRNRYTSQGCVRLSMDWVISVSNEVANSCYTHLRGCKGFDEFEKKCSAPFAYTTTTIWGQRIRDVIMNHVKITIPVQAHIEFNNAGVELPDDLELPDDFPEDLC